MPLIPVSTTSTRARPRVWSALTLLTGIALLTGFAAGRRRNQTTAAHADARDRSADGHAPKPEPRPDGPVAYSPAGSHRLRPDVLLGPVLLVMIGIIVDRLRESAARESVTAWMLIMGATVAALLARSAGYPWAARGFYCFLVGFSWGAASLYAQAGLGAVPDAWVSSTLTASLLWFVVDLRAELRRVGPGHKVRAALVAGEHWLGFFVAWAVLAQLVYLSVSHALAAPGPQTGWTWLSMTAVTVLGSAAILALTVRWPRRRHAALITLPPRQSRPAPS